MTFDPTINAGNILTIALAIIAIIAGWYKFGGRIDMLEYRVKAIEETLRILSDTLKTIAETEKEMAVMNRRQLTIEDSVLVLQKRVEGLARGEGYIQARRANLDGEFSR